MGLDLSRTAGAGHHAFDEDQQEAWMAGPNTHCDLVAAYAAVK